MSKFLASIAAVALAGAISVGLAASPAAAATVAQPGSADFLGGGTDEGPVGVECTDCLAPGGGSSNAIVGGMPVPKNFALPLGGTIGPPDCVTGCDAVPEPKSWALLMLGFGLAGASLRAGRRLGVA